MESVLSEKSGYLSLFKLLFTLICLHYFFMEKPLFTKLENLLRSKFFVKLLTLLLVFFGSFDSLFALQYANVINFNKEQYKANSKN